MVCKVNTKIVSIYRYEKQKMTNVIPILKQTIGNENVHCVNARELWQRLGSKQDFSTWVKKRIADTQAIEGVDFVISKLIPQKNGIAKGGDLRSIEYFINIDIAKEFAMLERNAIGQAIRRYFIECERRLQQCAHLIPQSYADALLECARLEGERERLAKEAQENAPLVAHAKAIAITDGILMADFAKLLCKNGVNVGQNRLFKWLRSEGYLMQGNKPYQHYVDRGYFETSASTIQTNHGAKEVTTTRITGKGQIALSDKITKAFLKGEIR